MSKSFCPFLQLNGKAPDPHWRIPTMNKKYIHISGPIVCWNGYTYAILWRTNEKQNKNCTPNKHLFKLWIIKNTKTGWPKCSHYHSPIFLPSHPLLHWHFRFRYLLVHSLLRTVSTRENRSNTGDQRKENKRSSRHITQWFYATGYTHNITVG